MRCYLAVFDQAHRAADGSYWTWRHSDVPLRTLDAFYYECAVKHWPESADPIPGDGLRGGCASVDDEWVCWYRFVAGGRDKFGRPGRHVLLAAFVERGNHDGRDWSGLLDSQEFRQLAQQARAACPVPAPDDLEMQWKPLPVVQGSTAADRLRRTGHESLEVTSDLAILAVVCSTVPLDRGFDCFVVKENGTAQVTFTPHDWPGRQLSALPDISSTSPPVVSSRSQIGPTSLLQRLSQTEPRRAKWKPMRPSRQVVTSVVVFFVGTALGAVVGWQLRGLSYEPIGTHQRDERDLREPTAPVLHREDDAGNRVGSHRESGNDGGKRPPFLEDPTREQ